MKNKNNYINACICKCGNVSCRNIRIRSFRNQIPENDQFVYSILHHKSLHVFNSKSIVIDKCCGNCLLFHCSRCMEQFSIIKIQKFIFGFNSDRMTYLEPSNCNKIVVIPEFPIVLRTFVCLSEQKDIENVKCNENSIIFSNFTLQNLENDFNDEIFYFDSDEDIMFGSPQNELIIGKYNECSICSFGKSYTK